MGKVYTLRNGPGRPASNDQLVGALIALANGRDVEFLRHPHDSDDAGQHVGADQAKLRTEVTRLLETFVDDPVELAEDFVRSVGLPLINSLKVSPVLDFGTRGFSLGYFRDFPTLLAAMQYAVLLLLDLEQPYNKVVSRCHLRSCGIFYIAKKNPKGGPVNRLYCSPAHRNQAHDSKQNRPPRKPK